MLLPWMLVYAASVAVTAVILIRVPWHPLGLWLAIGSLITARDVLLPVLEIQLASDAPAASIALVNLARQWISLLPVIGIAHVLGLFPDGEVHRRYERTTLRLTWLILVIPVVLLACSPTVHTVDHRGRRADREPVQGSFRDPRRAGGEHVDGRLVAGGPARRRRAARAAVPISGRADAPCDAVAARAGRAAADSDRRTILLTGDADVIVSLVWAAVIVCFMVAPALGILQPSGLNVDRVVRRSIVYGLLWTSIATRLPDRRGDRGRCCRERCCRSAGPSLSD